MHLASSGRVIVQLNNSVAEGQILCDEKSTRIAKVMELIGPVSKPYASAIPMTNNIKKYKGKKVFAIDSIPAIKQKKFRRKRKWIL